MQGGEDGVRAAAGWILLCPSGQLHVEGGHGPRDVEDPG